MKKTAKNLLYDTLHRGFVYTSVAVTIGGSILLGYRVYHYFTAVKPLHKQLLVEKEQQLLSEGMDKPDGNSQLKM